MFKNANVFNQLIGNWNTSNVSNMSFMFPESVFNNCVSKWDTKSVTDMSWIFNGSYDFNQYINNYILDYCDSFLYIEYTTW